MFICKHCHKEIDGLSSANKANHTRWCADNPKRKIYEQLLANARAVITGKPLSAERKQKLSDAHKRGCYDHVIHNPGGRKHSEESKKKISEGALKSKHRRVIRSVRDYICKDGSIIKLDSSWEEALAKRLDELNIEWVRPNNPIEYKSDDGKVHNYFPDFYLTKFNVYLDPKNPMVLSMQKEKLNALKEILPNLIILKSLSECKEFNLNVWVGGSIPSGHTKFQSI